MRFELMYESFFKILKGVPLTLEVVFISTLLGFGLAIIVALMRISDNRLYSVPAYSFIYLIRGTPLLLQLYFVYYGISQFSFVRESLWYKIERFFDRHNHLMEFIRTLLALIVLFLQLFIITRLVKYAENRLSIPST